ncbi:ABC transporter ATP-binding protein [Actinomadura violacea]|uniref:ABC transporter ATP-binding protein n=1 Tax=Actinomadura violacea TaxID=2819934 RepID=A0ABS3RR49_9ACTN|nr:ABC transporter ATP-binding protein [Actinomadura violacea]MBO2459191.1 ABC transporter ATP-binding protein [Actinomadura violacea]
MTVQTTETASAVEFAGVTKSYGAVRAVDGLDLRLVRGTSVALLGPNGAGKSTTIGMLLGLLQPDSGTVTLLGTTPEQAVRAGRVGAMPQSGRLIGRVTVRELLGFVRLAYAKKTKAVGRAAAVPALGELMEAARITELAGRKADQLSGGQAQRVRFAIAMAGAPDLVVLDEPTTGLDIEARRELWTVVRGYADRGGTVLFSTHYLEEADDHADRIVVIDRGRVVADGTSDDIKRRVPGRTVSFDLAGPAPSLEVLPGVVSSEVGGGRARLHTTDSDATVLALAEAGCIRNLEVAGARLEEAFLTLTHAGTARAEIRAEGGAR